MEKYLKNLLDFYSVSSNQQNVLELLEYVEKHFAKQGFFTEIKNYNGVYSLYASTKQSKHSKLLLQAHIDVVPGEEQIFRKEDGKYFGRGSYDMLFAAACYMQLCDDLGEQLQDMDLAYMLSGDEELGGFNGVKPFLEDGYTTDICILPDAGMGLGTLNIAAKGMYNLTIRIHGAAHHGSRPWEGDGAAAKLVHFLAEAEKLFDSTDQSNSTMTIAKLTAGDADNRGPAFADAILDIRYSNKTDLARIQKAITALLQKYSGKITLQVDGDDYQLDIDNRHVRAFLQLYKKHHGSDITLLKAHGSSDARFFSAKNIPVIMLRPEGSGAHGDNEWVSIEGTEKFYALLKDYVLKTATIGENDE